MHFIGTTLGGSTVAIFRSASVYLLGADRQPVRSLSSGTSVWRLVEDLWRPIVINVFPAEKDRRNDEGLKT
jgi:hypothetical protein